MNGAPFRYPIWTRGDLDGFFGLMVDNLVQVLMIIFLCGALCGMPAELVAQRVLPGVALSLLVGNFFYGLQARFVAHRDRNPACTALPYGINTPSVFAFALFIMKPTYDANVAALGQQAAADLAWKAGMLACLVSGAIELGGAPLAERLRRATPRAALLGVLAGVGVTFISADFAFRIFAQPLVGMLPLGLLLLAYFAHFRFPAGIPGGFLAVFVGTALAWLVSIPWIADALRVTPLRSVEAVVEAAGSIRLTLPQWHGAELLTLLSNEDMLLRFLTISIPMGLLNLLGSLQNIESAEAAGDRFATAPSLAVNGIGSLTAGLFGSCFPTTIYIGHPGWKALGARSGYSLLNGAFFAGVFVCGLGPLVAAVIPIEAGAAIVLYIGLLITAQAFQATPARHAPAVALAFFPAMAALLCVHLPLFLADGGATRSIGEMAAQAARSAVPTLPGMLALRGANESWLLATLLLTAAAAHLIDRRYRAAAAWMGSAALLTALGLLHAYRITPSGDVRELFIWQTVLHLGASAASAPATALTAVHSDRALPIAAGYAATALLLAWAGRRAGSTYVAEQPG